MAVAEMGQASSTDFRSAAVEASRHVLSAGRITDPDRADLSKLGASLCVPAPGDPAQFRRSLGMRMILVAVLGVGGVFAGWLILKYFGGGDAPNEPMRPMGWVGAGVSVFGMLSLLSAWAFSGGRSPGIWSETPPFGAVRLRATASPSPSKTLSRFTR